MKTNLKTIASAIAVLFLYYFSVSALKSTENTHTNTASFTQDTFTNCILNSEYTEVTNFWGRPELQVTNQLNRYKELNFNSIHQYDEMGSGRYGMPYDTLSPQQISNFVGVLDSVKNENLYSYFERSFLSKYCYGQRLIYEVTQPPGNNTENYGFCYQNTSGCYETDSGRSVLHVSPNPILNCPDWEETSGRYIARNIYENLQHSDLLYFRQNDKGMWYIKPVMRIPTGVPDSIPVVRIEVIPFGDTNVVLTTTIRAENFENETGYYGGNYIEKYYDLQPLLNISGREDTAGCLNSGWHDASWLWDTQCKVDFRVYWFGQCEVWFDKMIVDDEWAEELFNPLHRLNIDLRIKEEVNNSNDNIYRFFLEIESLSQSFCTKYIFDRIRKFNSYSRISIDLNNNFYTIGLKNDKLNYKNICLNFLHPDFLSDNNTFYIKESILNETFAYRFNL